MSAGDGTAPRPRTPEAAEAWLRQWVPDSHQEDADAALADLRDDAAPDDAHTSTARHTEWLTVGTEDGDEGAETFETEDEAQRAADRWHRRGMTNVFVERHDVATTRAVSTTTRTTDWKADEQ